MPHRHLKLTIIISTLMHHCYFNGQILSALETKIHVNDLGLLRGYGVFDYFRTYNKKPFQWDWYWERFVNSASILRLPIPIQKDDAFKAVNRLIELGNLPDYAIRFLLTGGYSENGISLNSPNLMIISEDIHSVKKEEYENGIRVISYEYLRDFSEVKSTDYKCLMMLQSDIKKANATDVLFYKNDSISELSRSNVFFFENDKLITPNQNILKGITRRTVIELAKPYFEVIERNVSIGELLGSEEVFTTSTTKKILGIVQVDEAKIGIGEVGAKTNFLLELFNQKVEKW